jgi:hypothetical protein
MSQPQQDMLRNAQDWMGSLQAKAWHATVGTYFSDKQLGLAVWGYAQMSMPATVPMIGPDGKAYDIPQDQVRNALSQGANWRWTLLALI